LDAESSLAHIQGSRDASRERFRAWQNNRALQVSKEPRPPAKEEVFKSAGKAAQLAPAVDDTLHSRGE
jgi:hypothetical protein